MKPPRSDRQEEAAEGVGDADEDGADQRALDRADAADHDDDEGHDQDRLAHADLHRLDRADQRAGEAGERGAEGEDDGVEPGDVDAEGGDHLAVGLAGADLHAEAGAVDQEVEADGDGDADDDDGEAVERVAEAAERGRCRRGPSGTSR